MGLSGGADSLTLLWLLTERRPRIRVHYDLEAIYVDPGFDGSGAADALNPFCERLGIPLRVEWTDYGLQGHSPANRENPCFLCARLRRKRLFEIADELGCGTLALGHNKDDVIETLFLNMCYAGEISTMRPEQELFKGRFRSDPAARLCRSGLIRRFARDFNLPVTANPCPSAERSRRAVSNPCWPTFIGGTARSRATSSARCAHVRTDYLLK